MKISINSPLLMGIAALLLCLAGCQSTQTNVTSVGPSMGGPAAGNALGTQEQEPAYNSDVFLNVAVPVFDPGIPLDGYGNVNDKEVEEKAIWPQVRRLEANRFAVYTKDALYQTKSFGSVNVTPDANTTADVFVLGKINFSDTETIKIGIRVMDVTNDIWGEKEFEHQVSEGFYRDALREEANPYAPIFKRIARYVQKLLLEKSEVEKQTIQQVADVRYAAMYSPERFSHYLTTEKKGLFSSRETIGLNGAPSAADPMYQRISNIRAKDEQFIDDLQENYETFHATTQEAYSEYHKEGLAIAADIRRQKAKRAKQQAAALILGIGAILLDKNSKSRSGQAAATIGAIGAAYSLNEAIKSNRNIGMQREMLDEMGQNLDIKVTDQIVEFNEQTIELKGTAGEQYQQLRSKLYEIYQLEATPDTQL